MSTQAGQITQINPTGADIYNVPSPPMVLRSPKVTINDLDAAEMERLAFLAGAMSEASAHINKTLQTGYDFRSHISGLTPTNRELLEEKVGKVLSALHFLIASEDLDVGEIDGFRYKNLKLAEEELIHQPEDLFLRDEE
jgi:hypothetical protein